MIETHWSYLTNGTRVVTLDLKFIYAFFLVTYCFHIVFYFVMVGDLVKDKA